MFDYSTKIKNKIFRLRSCSSLSDEAIRFQGRMARQAGFTLVELLVVIAIIGILSTVAVISLNQARNKAKIAAGVAWVKSLVPLANLCDYNDGQIIPFAIGGPFCTTVSDIYWPSKIPSGFPVGDIASWDAVAGDGIWLIMADAPSPLSGWLCTQDGCLTP